MRARTPVTCHRHSGRRVFWPLATVEILAIPAGFSPLFRLAIRHDPSAALHQVPNLRDATPGAPSRHEIIGIA